MKLLYEVEADWVLLRTCNFRCTYCAIPLDELAGRITTYATPSEWLAAFNATGKSWLLHLTGGEPSVYPSFVNLCEHLTRNHYLSLNTNLSHPCMDQFSERVDPGRVHYINAALHYDERVTKDSIDVFIERVQRFESRGFNVLISSVMTPGMAERFSELQSQFEASGLFIIPKAMRGWCEGQLYPDSYTKDQRRFISVHLARAREKYAPAIARTGEHPTINMLEDERFLKSVPSYTGKLCASGVNFVQIEPDGGVLRCNSGQRLGNILLRNLSLLETPRRCDTTYCPYFCEKYTAPRFVAAEGHPGRFRDSLSLLIGRVLRT